MAGTNSTKTVAEIVNYVRAGFTGIWLVTKEYETVVADLAKDCREREWGLAEWDASSYFRLMVDPTAAFRESWPFKQDTSPRLASGHPLQKLSPPGDPIFPLLEIAELSAARSMDGVRETYHGPKRMLVILRNFQTYINTEAKFRATSVIQTLQNLVFDAKSKEHGGVTVILVGSGPEMHPELEQYFVLVEHSLPDKEQLWQVVESLLAGPYEELRPKTEQDKDLLLAAASGMTARNAEDAISLSIIRNKKVEPATVWEVKAQTLKKQRGLRLYSGHDSFENIGGLDHFKEFSTGLLSERRTNPKLFPRGLLLLGVSGSGKSASVKCLSQATGRRVIQMDVGSLRSKFQGETDMFTRQALETADAMAPCILFVDELDKALAGVASSGETDGGASARVFGTFLTWLNDHTSDVFFVGTCNNIAALPVEFSRAERFDGMFFFDLPVKEERERIWEIFLREFDIAGAKLTSLVRASRDWTGAEIRTCCRLAAMLNRPVSETVELVSPVSKTDPDGLANLRSWASGRCLSATYPGLFDKDRSDDADPIEGVPKRKVHRKIG